MYCKFLFATLVTIYKQISTRSQQYSIVYVTISKDKAIIVYFK